MIRCVLIVVTLVVIGFSCREEAVEIQATINTAEAMERVEQVIAYVEDPNPQIRVHTSSLNVIQALLLNGNADVPHDGPSVPGLTAAEDAVSRGDESEFCEITGAVIRGSFVNRVMSPEALDAVRLTETDIGLHDPRREFMDRDGEIRLMGYGILVERQALGIEGNVVSDLWKDTALELMDIIYGLGQECVDAAKEA